MSCPRCKVGIWLLMGAVTAWAAPAASGADRDRRPNIVVILADDLGFSDLGCYGSEIATPHLDRLAAGGMRFTQFYNAARCCPSRAALLTGVYPHQAGIGHMTRDFGLPGYRRTLSQRCLTIAEALSQAGYHTAMSGKWHVGQERGHGPVDRGFEHFFGLLSGACSYFERWPGRPMAIDREPYEPPKDFYMTDAITDHAVAFIQQYAREPAPFFLHVAYTAPHAPLHALPEDVARYAGRYDAGWDAICRERFERLHKLGLLDPRWALAPRDRDVPAWQDVDDKPAWAHRMAVYAAQIDRMDQGIGRIMARLRELGIEGNTLVLFLSDNGGCAEELDFSKPGSKVGEAGCDLGYGVGWANVSDTPFRLFKRYVHEGGISTPLIAYWPEGIRSPGTITGEVGHIIDILPTCLEAAGAVMPRTYKGGELMPVEGRSFLSALRGQPRAGHEHLFWEHEGNRAVRRGRWKLVATYLKPWELYDLESDRTELHDVAAEHPDIVAALADAYDQWARRCGVVPPHELLRQHGVAADRRARPAPHKVERGAPQLFIDDELIAQAADVTRTLHQPRKDNGGEAPVIAPLPGSETLMAKGTILRDPRLNQYVMFVKDLPSRSLCRSVSADGLTWSTPERVELDDRHPATGRRADRQYAGMHCIHYDNADCEHPYKGWVYFGDWGPRDEGVYFIRSADGIRWERGPRVVEGYAGPGDLTALMSEQHGVTVFGPGDTTRFGYDPDSGRFLGIFKFFTTHPVGPDNHLRSRAFMFLDRLDQPVAYKQFEDIDLLPPAADVAGDRAADEYYESTAWRFGGLWLGELLVWHGRDDYPHSEAGCSFLKLISSRDGLHWNQVRYRNEASTEGFFLAGGRQGGNDGRNDGGHLSCFSQGPIRIGDELVFYYGASSWGKTAPVGRRVTGGGIFRARLRVDGFVSVDGGTLLTRPLVFDGQDLFINSAGTIGVEVLDRSGRVLGSTRVSGDSIAQPVTFTGKSLRGIAPEPPVQLRFQVERVSSLYSFTIR